MEKESNKKTDLRIIRTTTNIKNAFLKLRSSKSLERITVKELSDLALINKATFYMHYKDIYDLSSQMEDEILRAAINDVPHPEELIKKPQETIYQLTVAVVSRQPIIDILFSGNRHSILIDRYEELFKKSIYSKYPSYHTLNNDIIISLLIQGSFHAHQEHREANMNEIIDILGELTANLLEKFEYQ